MVLLNFFFGDTSVSPVSAPTPRCLFAPAIRFVAGPSYRRIMFIVIPIRSIRRYVDTSIRRYVDTSIRRSGRYCYALLHVERRYGVTALRRYGVTALRRYGVTYCRHRRHVTSIRRYVDTSIRCIIIFRYCGKSLVKNTGHCSKSEQGASSRRRTLRAGPPGRRAAGPS